MGEIKQVDESEICPDVRRVARAITRAEGMDPDQAVWVWGHRIPEGECWAAWHLRVPMAIAAIEAWLREEE